jgi:threonine dehydrogenase-like Zn-dependent dehydrogenase
MNTRMMQAATLVGPRRFEVIEVAVPEPNEDEIRVRLEGCGICASNLSPWEGQPWFNYPMDPGSPGHESWGTVEKVGVNVCKFITGDRVGLLSTHGFAEYDIANQHAAIKLPETLARRPFPAEPLGCAANVFRRALIRRGQTVAVVGIGFLGTVVVRLAVLAGARVIAITRRKEGLEMAKLFGASDFISMKDHWYIIECVNDLTGGHFCDVVIEATGKQWPLDLSADITAVRGRLLIAGYHQDGPRQVNMQLWNWRGLDVINAHERDPSVYQEGMQIAIDAIASGALDPRPLYTHAFRLKEIGHAFEIASERPSGFMKALVTF